MSGYNINRATDNIFGVYYLGRWKYGYPTKNLNQAFPSLAFGLFSSTMGPLKTIFVFAVNCNRFQRCWCLPNFNTWFKNCNQVLCYGGGVVLCCPQYVLLRYEAGLRQLLQDFTASINNLRRWHYEWPGMQGWMCSKPRYTSHAEFGKKIFWLLLAFGSRIHP